MSSFSIRAVRHIVPALCRDPCPLTRCKIYIQYQSSFPFQHGILAKPSRLTIIQTNGIISNSKHMNWKWWLILINFVGVSSTLAWLSCLAAVVSWVSGTIVGVSSTLAWLSCLAAAGTVGREEYFTRWVKEKLCPTLGRYVSYRYWGSYTSILADVHQQTKSAFGVKWIRWADAKAKGEEVRNIGHRSGMKDEKRRSLSNICWNQNKI